MEDKGTEEKILDFDRDWQTIVETQLDFLPEEIDKSQFLEDFITSILIF